MDRQWWVDRTGAVHASADSRYLEGAARLRALVDVCCQFASGPGRAREAMWERGGPMEEPAAAADVYGAFRGQHGACGRELRAMSSERVC